MPIEVYTDGACSGNPGKGGYGAILRLIGTDYEKEFSQGYKRTTNNRMELLAVIVALEKITKPNQSVTIYSDSKYVVDSVTKGWVFGWQKKGFKDKKNPDLWKRFLNIYPKHQVKFVWVKGHAGNPMNERVDRLAVKASQKMSLLEDSGFNN